MPRYLACNQDIMPRSLAPNLLDEGVVLPLAHGVEGGAAGLVLQDPVAGVGAILDLGQHALHLGLGGLGDDAGAAGIVAVLGRV